MAEDWSIKEVRLVIKDYFRMLELETKQEKYSKTAFRNQLLPRLNGRSKGSVEFKHQNISAVLHKFGMRYINGYKPLSKFQDLLKEEVERFMRLKGKASAAVAEMPELFQTVNSVPGKFNYNSVLDEDPSPSVVREPRAPYFSAFKTDYLEKEQRNRTLGDAGEGFVFEYEKWRLINEGKQKLAAQVEWIAKSKGDGAGYDILSKNIDGTNRYIEVKATNLSRDTPIFVTENEIEFSKINCKEFYLYRVFNFSKSPKIFIRHGAITDFCELEPQTYKGYFL